MTMDTDSLFVWTFGEGHQVDAFVASSEAEALRLYRIEYVATESDLDGLVIRKVSDDALWHLDEDGEDEDGPIERTIREHIERFGKPGHLCRNWDV